MISREDIVEWLKEKGSGKIILESVEIASVGKNNVIFKYLTEELHEQKFSGLNLAELTKYTRDRKIEMILG
jgi:fibrillarin-like rRNA methylase